MNDLKLLLVEDNLQDIETCRATLKTYQRKHNRSVILVECQTFSEALEKLDPSFDGAIVDLRLDNEGDEGNDVVKEIQNRFRIPVIVFTGTPSNAEDGLKYLGVYKKGEATYNQLIDILFNVFDTGITKILGGRGVLEDTMNMIFWNNLLPTLDSWKEHVSNGKETEKSILRFTINHFLELLEEGEEACFAEEMYIHPPISDNVKTGSIVLDVESNTKTFYIVLSPACDLAVHNGNMKTNRVMVCKIENRNLDLIKSARKKAQKKVNESESPDNEKELQFQLEQAKDKLSKIARNTYSNYYHYLPRTKIFEGGIIDFRKIITYTPREFIGKFNKPLHQVSMPFTKDIVARFSSYYGRQGQPDFNFDDLLEDLFLDS